VTGFGSGKKRWILASHQNSHSTGAEERRPEERRRPRRPGPTKTLETFKVSDQIGLLFGGEAGLKQVVVVIDYGLQGGEPAVMVEASLFMREKPFERRSPVHFSRRPAGLKCEGLMPAEGFQFEVDSQARSK
jgi:hypothetical protein